MDLHPFWKEDVLSAMQLHRYQVEVLIDQRFYLLRVNKLLIVHLVPLVNNFSGDELIALQQRYENQQLIHLWEDIWTSRNTQVINRINSLLGLNTSIYARQCQITELDLEQSKEFYNAFHLQGYVKCQQTYGLTINQQLIAAASFSKVRPMKRKGPAYQSAELIRFATKDHFTVVGGLSKLIKHFLKQVKVNDLMTYADRDWSAGKGYKKLGFALSEILPPATLYIDKETLTRYFPHRLPSNLLKRMEHENIANFDDYLTKSGFVSVFNTGSLKYHLYL